MKVALLQVNPTIGDFEDNFKKILSGYIRAVSQGAHLVVTSELALFGYPPADLLFRRDALDRQQSFFEKLCHYVGPVGLVIGIAMPTGKSKGQPLYNSAVLVRDGRILYRQAKALLPNYDVFDERRYFEPADASAGCFDYEGRRLAALVCEDIWGGSEDQTSLERYHRSPVADLIPERPDLLVSINASPFHLGKLRTRLQVARAAARKLQCPVVYVNQAGGNDELIFDGQSFVIDRAGSPIAVAQAFEGDCLLVDLDGHKPAIDTKADETKDLYKALVVGTRDYVYKTNLAPQVFVALSGGIDSAVTAAIAAEAVGAQNVFGISMPSAFSSEESIEDAQTLAENLGIAFQIVPIGYAYQAFEQTLKPLIGWNPPGSVKEDVTEENIQARIRGDIMMAIANRQGGIVLATGNKSELSVGYCTLYGDMVGGFAVLADVVKTKVYELANYINRHREMIPTRTILKAPSAELRPEQKDQDVLPEYEILDPIVEAYIEKGLSSEEIVQSGFDEKTVTWVLGRINANEYKRRQMAPGLKVTPKAYGVGRRIPIACKI